MAIHVIKKSVSFQPEVVKKLSQKAKNTHRSFSDLINEAARHLLEEEERSSMETAYKSYFSDPAIMKEEMELSKADARVSEESWSDLP